MPINIQNHKALDTYYAALATYRDKDVAVEKTIEDKRAQLALRRCH